MKCGQDNRNTECIQDPLSMQCIQLSDSRQEMVFIYHTTAASKATKDL